MHRSVGRPHVSKFSVQYGNYRLSVVQNLFIFVACIIQGKTINLYELRNEVGKITEKWLQLNKSQKFPMATVDFVSPHKVNFERLQELNI